MSESKTSTILGSDLSSAAYDALLTDLGVLYPNLGNDPHELDLIDEYEQFSRLHASAVKYFPRAFIDSTDSGLQVSVKAGQWQDESGTWRSVAEVLNKAVTNAAANYLYYPSTATSSSDLVINTTGWPTTPHIRIAIVTPANSEVIPDNVDDRLSMNLLRPVGGAATTSVATALVFTYTNVTDGLTGQALVVGGSARGIVMPKAGYIVGSSVTIDDARTAGSAVFAVAKATSAGGSLSALADTSLSLTLDGSATLQNTGTVTYGTAAFAYAAGNRLGILLTTSSWTPDGTPDATAVLWVVNDP